MMTSRSVSSSARFATGVPNEPIIPRFIGSTVGSAPRPIIVVTTGIPAVSESRATSRCARALNTPPPAQISGCFAPCRDSQTRLI